MKAATSTVYIPDHKGTEALAKAHLLPRYKRLSRCFLVGCALYIATGVVGISKEALVYPAFIVAMIADLPTGIGAIYLVKYKRLYAATQLAATSGRLVKVPTESVPVIEMLQQIRLEATKRRHGVVATLIFEKILRYYASGNKEKAKRSIGTLHALARD